MVTADLKGRVRSSALTFQIGRYMGRFKMSPSTGTFLGVSNDRDEARAESRNWEPET